MSSLLFVLTMWLVPAKPSLPAAPPDPPAQVRWHNYPPMDPKLAPSPNENGFEYHPPHVETNSL